MRALFFTRRKPPRQTRNSSWHPHSHRNSLLLLSQALVPNLLLAPCAPSLLCIDKMEGWGRLTWMISKNLPGFDIVRFVFPRTIIRWNIVVVTVFVPFSCSEIDEKRGGQIAWIKEHKTFPDSNPRGHSFLLCDFEQVTSFSEPVSSSLKCKKDRTYLERLQWGLKMAESLSKGNMSARRHVGAWNRKASQTSKRNEGHLLYGVTEKSQWVLIQGWKRSHMSF